MASSESFSCNSTSDFSKLKKDQDQRKTENKQKVSLLKIFTFADFYDYVLMAIGSVGACVPRALVLSYFIFFGKLINVIRMAYLVPKESSQKVAYVS